MTFLFRTACGHRASPAEPDRPEPPSEHLRKTGRGRRAPSVTELRWLAALAAIVAAGAGPAIARQMDEGLCGPDAGGMAPVMLVLGDNQAHQSRGSGSLLQATLWDRLFTEVTRRPPQQSLFPDAILSRVISRVAGMPILHLGDALDVSCSSEAEHFFSLWPGTQRWAMVPGNHDGYMLGNADPKAMEIKRGRLTSGQGWRLLCEDRVYFGWDQSPICGTDCNQPGCTNCNGQPRDGTGGGEVSGFLRRGTPLRRDEFLKRYLREVIGSTQASGSQIGVSKTPFLHAAAWNIDSSSPWTSHLMQWARVSNDGVAANLFLLDTNQYETRPGLGFGLKAGVTGSIAAAQWKRLREWLGSDVASRGDFSLVVGHHDWESLDRETRRQLRTLFDAHRVAAYVSAHSHDGWVDDGSPHGIREVNVGSITDAPVHFRALCLGRRAGVPALRLHATPLEAAWAPGDCTASTDDGCCPGRWRIPDDHRASPAMDQGGSSPGWFIAAHRELNGQMMMLHHLLGALESETAITPDLEITYFRMGPGGGEGYTRLRGLTAIRDELSAASEFDDDNERGRPTTRNKASLVRAVQKALLDKADRTVVEKYAWCQAVDGAWRDAERQRRKRSVIREKAYLQPFRIEQAAPR